jgi:AcrR family transcriptional regulator
MAVSPAPPGRRERKKAATRRAISDAATHLFLERGFDNVTVKEVADAADVSPTTVFKHFPTKESLVFDEGPGQQAALVAAVRNRAPGQSMLDAIEEHLMGGRLMRGQDDQEFHAFLALVDGTPALRDYERRMLMRRESALAAVISATAQQPVTTAQALGVARFVLQSADIARDQPDPRGALADLFTMLRTGCRL